MTQMPSKLVDVVSALETLNFPYVLYREDSGAHRVFVEGASEAAVLDALASALGSDVGRDIEFGGSERIVIEAKAGSGKSSAALLWWLALREGSKAARAVAHTDIKPSNIVVDTRHTADNPE